MDSTLREVLDLVFRWIHVIAGIMWVGNSMLFNWLDRNLEKREGQGPRSFGEIWMLHSGAWYQVEKKWLAPDEMPPLVHWFKWQSYTTWMTGFMLLVVVYYLGGKSFLVDPQVLDMGYGQAVGLSLGLLVGGWVLYDGLWRLLGLWPNLATGLTLGLLTTFVVGITYLFSGRAAYIHVGALMGSLMAGNVFFHIIPSQKQMVAATTRGELADPALGLRAKTRSIHNNYLTFPVLFVMISNHFPSTWGHPRSWMVLGVLVLGGATVRHFLNIRFTFQRWLPALLTTVVLTIGALYTLVRPATAAPIPTSEESVAEQVAFPVVKAIVDTRCVPCHAAKPTDPSFGGIAAGGIQLDDPPEIVAHAERIKVRAVVTKTMPLVNKTGITPQEREVLGRWIDEGAHVPTVPTP